MSLVRSWPRALVPAARPGPATTSGVRGIRTDR